MIASNSYALNRKNMDEADKRAANITNLVLFQEPVTLLNGGALTVEVYEKQRIWLAKYAEERARILTEITASKLSSDLKQEVKPPQKYVPKFGNGAYYGMKDD